MVATEQNILGRRGLRGSPIRLLPGHHQTGKLDAKEEKIITGSSESNLPVKTFRK